MPWKECSVMDERLRFVAQLLDGEAMSEVCRASPTASWPTRPGRTTGRDHQPAFRLATPSLLVDLRRLGRRHVRATSAASLPCRLSPSTIREGGVLLAREQRRLGAIVTADVAAIRTPPMSRSNYSSLMPRTYLCARLLETLD